MTRIEVYQTMDLVTTGKVERGDVFLGIGDSEAVTCNATVGKPVSTGEMAAYAVFRPRKNVKLKEAKRTMDRVTTGVVEKGDLLFYSNGESAPAVGAVGGEAKYWQPLFRPRKNMTRKQAEETMVQIKTGKIAKGDLIFYGKEKDEVGDVADGAAGLTISSALGIFRGKKADFQWLSHNGQRLTPLSQMETTHLQNALAMLKREPAHWTLAYRRLAKPALEAELAKRGPVRTQVGNYYVAIKDNQLEIFDEATAKTPFAKLSKEQAEIVQALITYAYSGGVVLGPFVISGVTPGGAKVGCTEVSRAQITELMKQFK